jgi:hypothetical protein
MANERWRISNEESELIAVWQMPRLIWLSVSAATVVMALALIWGVTKGDLWTEGGAILDMPWGLVSLVEIYVGMALFGCWVFWRETSLLRSAAWMLAVALIGNLVSCVYVLLALRAARGDVMRFWLGARAARED